MIPFSRQKIFDDDIKAVTKVLRSNYLTKGKKYLNLKKIWEKIKC